VIRMNDTHRYVDLELIYSEDLLDIERVACLDFDGDSRDEIALISSTGIVVIKDGKIIARIMVPPINGRIYDFTIERRNDGDNIVAVLAGGKVVRLSRKGMETMMILTKPFTKIAIDGVSDHIYYYTYLNGHILYWRGRRIMRRMNVSMVLKRFGASVEDFICYFIKNSDGVFFLAVSNKEVLIIDLKRNNVFFKDFGDMVYAMPYKDTIMILTSEEASIIDYQGNTIRRLPIGNTEPRITYDSEHIYLSSPTEVKIYRMRDLELVKNMKINEKPCGIGVLPGSRIFLMTPDGLCFVGESIKIGVKSPIRYFIVDDVDYDGYDELVIVRGSYTEILKWGIPILRIPSASEHMVFADIDGDFRKEVVQVSTMFGRIYATIIALNGTVIEKEYTIGSPREHKTYAKYIDQDVLGVRSGDIDGDGRDEILLLAGGGAIYIIDPYEDKIYYRVFKGIKNFCVGDVDGDYMDELIVFGRFSLGVINRWSQCVMPTSSYTPAHTVVLGNKIFVSDATGYTIYEVDGDSIFIDDTTRCSDGENLYYVSIPEIRNKWDDTYGYLVRGRKFSRYATVWLEKKRGASIVRVIDNGPSDLSLISFLKKFLSMEEEDKGGEKKKKEIKLEEDISDIAFADFDGDGENELIVATKNRLYVYRLEKKSFSSVTRELGPAWFVQWIANPEIRENYDEEDYIDLHSLTIDFIERIKQGEK